MQAQDGRILGKLSLWDVLRGLEPRYDRPIDPLVMVNDYFLWTHSMFVNLAERAKSIRAKDLLREHSRDEIIDEDALSISRFISWFAAISCRFSSCAATPSSASCGSATSSRP